MSSFHSSASCRPRSASCRPQNALINVTAFRVD
ncbi:hypothetical protein T4B_6562 [Trichinella pseudospiralis]|uniref:Uncharacterized protein n=1 Tax=Trichinella pseudospiralis TaxID=6337 RepID=A0A0V1GDI3_TRIPS|nr:hypothetical protein T4B_6562 [Trichinella pseudospiralis]